jgi:polysaccharide biosynthesis/export protein
VTFMAKRAIRAAIISLTCWVLTGAGVMAQTRAQAATSAPQTATAPLAVPQPAPRPVENNSAYVLGPDDEITVRALDVDEIDGKVVHVDPSGNVDLPLVGKVRASGLSVSDFEAQLGKKLGKYVRDPRVSVTVSAYKSQPVSVLGSVNTPGVYDLMGPTTLEQVLSRAGGLRNDAGNTVNITRSREWGTIPLASAKLDASGDFSTASVSVKSLMDASDPLNNITVRPKDVISVPRADLVYVVGAVNRPGGFVLNERANMSVLQAVSMAEGLQKTSSPQKAQIIRNGMTPAEQKIPVNLTKVLSGAQPDVPLLANDILFVPNSAAKSATYRVLEAAIQTGTGIAIFH